MPDVLFGRWVGWLFVVISVTPSHLWWWRSLVLVCYWRDPFVIFCLLFISIRFYVWRLLDFGSVTGFWRWGVTVSAAILIFSLRDYSGPCLPIHFYHLHKSRYLFLIVMTACCKIVRLFIWRSFTTIIYFLILGATSCLRWCNGFSLLFFCIRRCVGHGCLCLRIPGWGSSKVPFDIRVIYNFCGSWLGSINNLKGALMERGITRSIKRNHKKLYQPPPE